MSSHLHDAKYNLMVVHASWVPWGLRINQCNVETYHHIVQTLVLHPPLGLENSFEEDDVAILKLVL